MCTQNYLGMKNMNLAGNKKNFQFIFQKDFPQITLEMYVLVVAAITSIVFFGSLRYLKSKIKIKKK